LLWLAWFPPKSAKAVIVLGWRPFVTDLLLLFFQAVIPLLQTEAE